MDAKISVTTRCNARCLTCPVWEYTGMDMPLSQFKDMWERLNKSNMVTRILLNNTGDLYNHPERKEIFEHIEQNKRKYVAMTTNAGLMDYVPRIDEIIISFNGGTKETYEYTTGLSWEETIKRIRDNYEGLRKVPHVEMHCLIWQGNAGTEDALLKTWADFPGRIRVSYKYDNQMAEDKTVEGYVRTDRIPCDYLGMLSIMPNGKIISCAHDFEETTNFGNIFDDETDKILEHHDRIRKIREHISGFYTGICRNCNYNTPLANRIRYLK